jgi:6,7-dimethyl-8-ribityllumazine synthase
MSTNESLLDASPLRCAIVAARFNDFIVASLLKGARRSWLRRGGLEKNLDVLRVPGAFELPLVAKALAVTGRYDAIVALGCVIRGDTAHFDHVAGECARGIMQAALDTRIPVIFGVLTVEDVEQAIERAALARADKGGEAMDAALETAALLRTVRGA